MENAYLCNAKEKKTHPLPLPVMEGSLPEARRWLRLSGNARSYQSTKFFKL